MEWDNSALTFCFWYIWFKPFLVHEKEGSTNLLDLSKVFLKLGPKFNVIISMKRTHTGSACRCGARRGDRGKYIKR